MSTGDRLDLEGIRQRLQRHVHAEGRGAIRFLAAALADDVPALLAEVDRLNAALNRVRLVRCWTNEDGRRFVFADDLTEALDGDR